MKRMARSAWSILICLSLLVSGMVGMFTASAETTADSLQAAFATYIAGVGNDFNPNNLTSLGGYTVSVTDYFITHAVDGVYDEATDYPLSIPGHDGSVAVVLSVDGASYGVTATIPHTEENLGNLTTDVYPTNFTVDGSGNITGYTGSAEKLVIPASSFSGGQINLNGTAAGAKANTKVVMIGDENADMTNLQIVDSSFRDWSKLRAVTLPNRMLGNFSYIDQNTFRNDLQLKYVRLPSFIQETRHQSGTGKSYGMIYDFAFYYDTALENIGDKNGYMPQCRYRDRVFSFTKIRDIYLPAYYYPEYVNNSTIFYNAFQDLNVSGVVNFISGSAIPAYDTEFMNKTTASSGNTIVKASTGASSYSYARTMTLAATKADALEASMLAANVTAENVASEIVAAASGKGYDITADWNGTFGEDIVNGHVIKGGTLTLTANGVGTTVPFAYDMGEQGDPEFAPAIRAAAKAYMETAGNDVTPAGLLAAVANAADGHTVTIEDGDFFVDHAVDGIYDTGDSSYPLSIPGHDGAAAVIFTVDGRDRVGVTCVIPHTEENLGFLTCDVYPTNFTVDGNGNITGYTGTAQKLVIPASFGGSIDSAINGSDGKDFVKALMILPTAATPIGANAFDGWKALKAVYITPSAQPTRGASTYGTAVFQNCSNLKAVQLPTNFYTKIGSQARGYIQANMFRYCTSLQNINLPIWCTVFPEAFYNTAIRAYYLTDGMAWNGSAASTFANAPAYTGMQYIMTYNGTGSSSYENAIVMPQSSYPLARAMVMAQEKADTLTVTAENADTSAAAVIGAFSGKYSSPCTASWDEDYAAATLLVDNARVEIDCARDTSHDIDLQLVMLNGAQVRMKDPTGLRFTADVFGATEALASGKVSGISYGMLIAPADYISGDFTAEALDAAGKSYLDIACEYWRADSALYKEMSMVISNVKAANYARDFSARAYADVTFADDTTVRIYADFNAAANTRNISDVAGRALADTSRTYTAEEQAVLESFIVE